MHMYPYSYHNPATDSSSLGQVMSNITGVLRDGWHPKGKDGGRESWRGDFKGVNQVVSKSVHWETTALSSSPGG
jgi:hypothetical protein